MAEAGLWATVTALLAVALGSAAGGAARFLISGLVARAVGETFPWGTMAVNVTGALALGVLAGILDPATGGAAALLWQLAATGFLGSYTTVSSFTLQTLALAQEGEARRAAGNVALSLLFGLSAAAFGFVLAGGVA